VILLFFSVSRPTLELTQPPVLRVPGAVSAGVTRPRHEADHSSPSSAHVKNEQCYTSTLPYVLMVWCLIKHRENFAFTLKDSQSRSFDFNPVLLHRKQRCQPLDLDVQCVQSVLQCGSVVITNHQR
jgi:hypothetical protein